MDAQKNNTNLGDISFSSYLNSAEDVLPHKLADSIQKSYSVHENPGARSFGRSNQEAEISVFGAEKYFNMRLDEEGPGKDFNFGTKENQVDQMKPIRSRPGTPSIASESSWNSQTALLTRKESLNKTKKVKGRSFLAGLSCNGSCTDEKSVCLNHDADKNKRVHGRAQLDQNHIVLDGSKQSKPRFQVKHEPNCPRSQKVNIGPNREEYFALQIKKSDVQHLKIKKPTDQNHKIKEQAWKSAKVLNPNSMNKGDIAMNLEKKLSMLTWDAIPNAPTMSITSMSSKKGEDIESDASSDLFEIDNISGSVPQSTLYEPSEASIEWSVVTASAADFSVASNYDEKKAVNVKTYGAKTKSMVHNELQTSRSAGLLGCKSQKAVSVSETAYRSLEKSKPHPNLPVRMLQHEIKGERF